MGPCPHQIHRQKAQHILKSPRIPFCYEMPTIMKTVIHTYLAHYWFISTPCYYSVFHQVAEIPPFVMSCHHHHLLDTENPNAFPSIFGAIKNYPTIYWSGTEDWLSLFFASCYLLPTTIQSVVYYTHIPTSFLNPSFVALLWLFLARWQKYPLL